MRLTNLYCVLCGCPCPDPDRIICEACMTKLTSTMIPYQFTTYCPLCGMPEFSREIDCIRCHGIDEYGMRIYSLFKYSGYAKELIRLYKFSGCKELAYLIAQLIFSFADDVVKRPVVFVPVPCSHSSFIKRGWDQMSIICMWLRRFGCAICECIRRSTTSKELKHMKRSQRTHIKEDSWIQLKENSQTVFDDNVTYILLDDVLTTGSTLKACKSLLDTYGVKQIVGLTIAMD